MDTLEREVGRENNTAKIRVSYEEAVNVTPETPVVALDMRAASRRMLGKVREWAEEGIRELDRQDS